MNEAIEDYRKFLNGEEENDNRVYDLINGTQLMIDSLKSSDNNDEISLLSSSPLTDYYVNALSLAVVYFRLNNYYLSAELLTQAFQNQQIDKIYFPFYGGRIAGANLTKDIYNSKCNDLLEFETYFPEIKTVYETNNDYSSTINDLKYSIHGITDFHWESDTKLVIEDRYDFLLSNENNFSLNEYISNDAFANMQNAGVITPFQVRIPIDYSKKIDFNIEIINMNTFKVGLSNNTNQIKEIIYNETLGTEEDCLRWDAFSNIKFISLNPYSYSEIIIYAGIGDCLALSFIESGRRYITIANDLSTLFDYNIILYERESYINENIEVLGKNNNEWILKVYNFSNVNKNLTFNSKMCNKNDALEWKNLLDLNTLLIEANSSQIINVQENYFARYIAMRMYDERIECRYALTNLDINTNFSLEKETILKDTYLNVDIVKKIGNKWIIRVYYPFAENLQIQYNSKMCYDDARLWKENKLKDLTNLTISPSGTEEIEISQNFFATSIGLSFVKNGYRYITYANNLNVNGSINVMNSKLSI